MKNYPRGIDNRPQIREQPFSESPIQDGLHVFSADAQTGVGAGSNLTPHVLKDFLDFGNHEFSARTLDPGCNGGAKQELIHCRDLSKEVLLVGHVHSGISTQRSQAVNVRGWRTGDVPLFPNSDNRIL